jgi:serine kinase of HPr protein (carbohydrate metabolism regulator)
VTTPHQATCVAIGERAVLIEGAPGSGKSSLALALIDRGATLIGDDGVLLESRAGALVAKPHPNTRGLLEIRNLGLMRFPVLDQAAVALLVRLDEAAPRFVERPESAVRGQVGIPMLRISPLGPVLHLKVELALARFCLG